LRDRQRQGMQLKLQSTVQGLSVAAITYYIVGLVSYAAKSAASIGWRFSPDTSAAAAILIVAVVGWQSIRRLHPQVHRSLSDG